MEAPTTNHVPYTASAAMSPQPQRLTLRPVTTSSNATAVTADATAGKPSTNGNAVTAPDTKQRYRSLLTDLQQQQSKRRLQAHAYVDDKSTAIQFTATEAPLPRYLISIVDGDTQVKATQPTSIKCALLLIPQQQQYDWIFSSEEGQLKLCNDHKFHRLILVAPLAGHTFTAAGGSGTTELIKAEVNTIATLLLPRGVAASTVPYLAVADEVIDATPVATIHSEKSGVIVVEDVRQADAAKASRASVLRRFRFMSVPSVVQSEMRIYIDNDQQLHYDHTYVSLAYQHGMIAALALRPLGSIKQLTLIGLGCGNLPMLLHTFFGSSMHVHCIEYDASVEQMAKQHFDFQPDGTSLTSQIADGLQYIHELSKKCQTDSVLQQQCIMIDVNTFDLNEGVSLAPPQFVSVEYLTAVTQSLTSGGLVIINVAVRPQLTRQQYLHNLYSVFAIKHHGAAYILPLSDDEEDVNIVAIGVKGSDVDDSPHAALALGHLYNNLVTVDAVQLLRQQQDPSTKLLDINIEQMRKSLADINLEHVLSRLQQVTFNDPTDASTLQSASLQADMTPPNAAKPSRRQQRKKKR